MDHNVHVEAEKGILYQFFGWVWSGNWPVARAPDPIGRFVALNNPEKKIQITNNFK